MYTQYKEDIIRMKVQTTGIEIYKGDAAFTLMSDESFLKSWDVLYDLSEAATVFQSSQFVTTWYQTYKIKFLPIIILSKSNNRLNGLLTLAIPLHTSKKSVITGAGEYEAEYQTWLRHPDENERFITSAFQKLMEEYPTSHIHLRFIPANVSLVWVKDNFWKSKSVLQQHRQPVMNLQDPNIPKMFRKTEFRNKLNRLKRLGNVEFLHITDKADFIALLNEVLVQFDFRQGAMFNFNQFKEEPIKAKFLQALFDKGLLHVSALKVNGQLFASIIAIAMRDWVHLGGINVHTPFHAKFYSPGFIHFILLAEHLYKTKISFFDLTPGGDFYKERMATQHKVVHELVITNSTPYIIKRKIRKLYYKKLEEAGKWPMGVELSVRKKLYLLKRKVQKIKAEGLTKSFKKAFELLPHASKNELLIYKNETLKNDTQLQVNRNNLNDLLQFKSEGTWKTRWEFLEQAMRRFEVGQNCYTYCKNGNLLFCIWHTDSINRLINSINKADLPLLDGLYYHPQYKTELNHYLIAVLQNIFILNKKNTVLASLSKNDRFLHQAFTTIGFETFNPEK